MKALLATMMATMIKVTERKLSEARRAASHDVTPEATGPS
jgi:hypothetical protein